MTPFEVTVLSVILNAAGMYDRQQEDAEQKSDVRQIKHPIDAG